MCSISLQILMENRTYPEAGEALYDILVEKIDCEDKIVLDMQGVVALPSMFLNTSLGRFIETYGVDLLKQKISFAKISATQAARIQDYIRRLSVSDSSEAVQSGEKA